MGSQGGRGGWQDQGGGIDGSVGRGRWVAQSERVSWGWGGEGVKNSLVRFGKWKHHSLGAGVSIWVFSALVLC